MSLILDLGQLDEGRQCGTRSPANGHLDLPGVDFGEAEQGVNVARKLTPWRRLNFDPSSVGSGQWLLAGGVLVSRSRRVRVR